MIADLLETPLSSSCLLKQLRERILKTTNGQSVLERGRFIKALFPKEAEETLRLAEEALEGRLILPGTGPEPYFVGNPPDWTYNPISDNEYTFHLNRMDHWKTMSEAYGLTGNLIFAKKVIEEMDHWISNNPCPPLKDEKGRPQLSSFEGLSPWRALEVGIRGYRTWPMVLELLANTPCFTEEFLEKVVTVAATHCRVLYEISPLLWPRADHNHYLMENLGLLSFSCLFPELKNREQWKQHAVRELDRCMENQCTSCGGQIEGCPSYHNGCVFWFSLRFYFSRKYGLTVPASYAERLDQMFLHSIHATRSCGGNFPWGDSHTADKETLSLAAVSCYLAYGDPVYLKTALWFYPLSTLKQDIRDSLWRFSDVAKLKQDLEEAASYPRPPKLPLVKWQKPLDQVYVRSGWNKDSISFMTACRTPVQNLHAHIDAGGFDFTAFGEPLVSDPGIYTYKDDENRRHFKSSLWHNCLTINSTDMWEYRGSWAYGPQREGHILSVEETQDFTSILSFHENYAPATVTRILALMDKRLLFILDMVQGLKSTDKLQVNFHLNFTEPHILKGRVTALSKNRPGLELVSSDPTDTIYAESGKISTKNDVWHDSTMVRFENQASENGTFCHGTLLIPHPAGDTAPAAKAFLLSEEKGRIHIRFTAFEKPYQYRLEGNLLKKE